MTRSIAAGMRSVGTRPMATIDPISRGVEVSLDDILAEGNIRSFRADDESAKRLAQSVGSIGVLQPILVSPRPGRPRFLLVAGFRRYSAACQAGLDRVPVRVLTAMDEARLTEIRLSENLHRMDMNPIEEATAIVSFMEQGNLSQEEAGARVGRSGAWVSTRVRLLELPEVVREMIRDGRLSSSNAGLLLPYVKRSTENFLIRAAKVGCRKGDNMGFASQLEHLTGARKRSPGPKGPGGACGCVCLCGLHSGAHAAGGTVRT